MNKIARILLSLSAVLTIVAPAAVSAQTANTVQIPSAQEYKTLLSRFADGQKLTDAQFAQVYYGAAAQPGFNASRSFTAAKQAYDSGDTQKAYRLVADGLKDDPTNLWLLFKAYALAAASTDKAVKALAPKYQTRLLGICDAIFNSGKGVTEMTP